MSDTTLTTFAAAAYVGLSTSKMEKLRVTGGGPAYCKIGRSVRYRFGDLDEWLASRRVASTSAS
jgi:excisionase family DNA binding protein